MSSPAPQRAAAVPAAGRGDDVARAARGRLGVVDAGQGGKPIAEAHMRATRPGYAGYAARTSGFFPLPPRAAPRFWR